MELGTAEAARYLGISRTSFRRTVKRGALRPTVVYICGGAKYDTADLDAYRAACRPVEGVTATDWSGYTPALVEQARRRVAERRAGRSSR